MNLMEDILNEMKIISFNAISLNGKVAGKNGNENFISDENWNEFCKLVNSCGFLIYGKRTYESVKSWGPKYINKIKSKIAIVSINGLSIKDAIVKAKQEKFKKIVICGGPNLNKFLWENNLINELIIDIEPVVVGDGLDLVGLGQYIKKLKLKDVKKMKNGIVQLRYEVKK